VGAGGLVPASIGIGEEQQLRRGGAEIGDAHASVERRGAVAGGSVRGLFGYPCPARPLFWPAPMPLATTGEKKDILASPTTRLE
jgi:hypothetical protein